MRKILFVFHKIGYGGAGKMLCFMANSLAKHDYEVVIYTYADEESPHYNLDDRVELITSIGRLDKPLIKRLHDAYTVSTTARKVNPDLIISLMSSNSFYGWIAARIIGAKLIVSERGDPASEKGPFARLKQFVMNKADGAIFQTSGAQAYFKNLTERSVIIANPVTESFRGSIPFAERKDRIAFVGRFEVDIKRQDLMLTCFSSLVKDFPFLGLDFYGDGPDLAEIKNLCSQLGCGDNVIFHGAVHNVAEKLQQSKYFVLASEHEGIPNSLIEALAMSCACVTTDCSPGGARLLVENGVNGLIVPRDSLCDLNNALRRLINDQSYAELLSHNTQSSLNKFRPDVIEKQLVSYIDKVLK